MCGFFLTSHRSLATRADSTGKSLQAVNVHRKPGAKISRGHSVRCEEMQSVISGHAERI